MTGLTAGRIRLAAAAAVAAAVALTATACSSGGSGGSHSSSSASSSPQLKGTVNVFAAASLTETFTQLGKDFEAAHPGVKVQFNFQGSSSLATSIDAGAPADVFASADEKNMKTVVDAGNVSGTPVDFVKNTLQIAVAPGNPKGITSLADLTKPGLKVALCATQVPCGSAAQTALTAAGVKLTPATYEQDVKSALTKLTLGEVDAAVVYRTDVSASGGKAQGVDFPQAAQAVNTYPITVLKGAPNADAARAFEAYVLSPQGRAVLTAAGFQAP